MNSHSASRGGHLSVVFATSIAVAAGIAAASLPLWLWRDDVSRHVFSSQTLQMMRVQEYQRRWKKCLQQVRRNYDQFRGHVALTRCVSKWEVAELIADWIEEDRRRKKRNEPSPFPRILGFRQDGESGEITVELDGYQIPMHEFSSCMTNAMKNQITSTTLCFVADASSGLASKLIADILEASGAGVPVIREATWLAEFALLLQEHIVGKERMEHLLFALCRMEASRIRHKIGKDNTVVFTLPGQAVTPILLPMLQSVFPGDRHIFAYDGCIPSVERALKARSRVVVPTSLDDALELVDDTPITTPMDSGLSKAIAKLPCALAKAPLCHADVVESWMASVDAFLRLKEEERTNGYLPFTLKIGYLVGNGCLDPNSDRYLILTSLLQFILGSRSRKLADGVLTLSVSFLRDFSSSCAVPSTLSEWSKRVIEDALFEHKEILTSNRRLKDTVQPSKSWSLKEDGSCECCVSDDDEDQEVLRNSSILARKDSIRRDHSTLADDDADKNLQQYVSFEQESRYMNGATGFAFDPSRFA